MEQIENSKIVNGNFNPVLLIISVHMTDLKPVQRNRLLYCLKTQDLTICSL